MASHSSGIVVPEEVKAAFTEANNNGTKRIIKIQIDIAEERMHVVSQVDPSGAAQWQDDLENVGALLDPKDACYLLIRTDEITKSGGYNWLLFCYVPDLCKVKQKMIYASTRAQLKLNLGGGNFSHDVFGTVKSDFDRAGFGQYLRSKNSAAPLTESEEMAQSENAMSAAEVSCLVGAGGASTSMLHGVSFQPQDAAQKALGELASGGPCYVQLTIDEAKEQIALVSKSKLAISELAEQVPNERPAFHVFRYDHTFEGKFQSPIIFIFSCPDGSGKTKSAPIKSRMLFSSCKSGVEALIESTKKKVDLKLEINEGVELTEDLISFKIHPPPIVKKAAFSKPKPAGKGPKRLTPSTSPRV